MKHQASWFNKNAGQNCQKYEVSVHYTTNPIPKSWDTVQIVNKKECNNLQIS